jgi:hypothetical protein
MGDEDFPETTNPRLDAKPPDNAGMLLTMGAARVKPLPPEDTPLKQLSADLRRVRADLAPSLDLILNCDLAEDDKLVAMRLFESALDDPWSELRSPSKAIEAAALARETA